MNVVLLSVARSPRPPLVDRARLELAGVPDARFHVVTWYPAKAPLPADTHLVLGPHIRVIGDLATVAQTADPAPLTSEEVEEAPPLEDPLQPAAIELEEAELAPVSETHDERVSVPLPPLYRPERIRAAIAWRVRRSRSTARRRVRQARRHPTFRKARNLLSPGPSTSFAVGCVRSEEVIDLVRAAGLVVALDAGSHRAAWALARKVAGPDVVIGLPAAVRVAEETRSAAG